MTFVTEPISFTTTSNTTETVVLNNSNLMAKGFIGVVSKDGTDVKTSIGFSNGTKNKSLSSSYSTSKNTDIDGSNSLLAYENAVLKIKGNMNTATTAGEVSFTFTTLTAGYTIAGIILGEE